MAKWFSRLTVRRDLTRPPKPARFECPVTTKAGQGSAAGGTLVGRSHVDERWGGWVLMHNGFSRTDRGTVKFSEVQIDLSKMWLTVEIIL